LALALEANSNGSLNLKNICPPDKTLLITDGGSPCNFNLPAMALQPAVIYSTALTSLLKGFILDLFIHSP